MDCDVRCPICKKPSPPRSENPAFPFCGPRCKAVDLGRWLGEEYKIASSSLGTDADDEAEGSEASARARGGSDELT